MVFRYVPDGKFKSYTSATNGLNRLIHNVGGSKLLQ